jgi:large subunit ribosomal protein L32e
MPSIGYGSNKKTRHCLPDGFKKFLVNNVVCESNISCISLAEPCFLAVDVAAGVGGRKRTLGQLVIWED